MTTLKRLALAFGLIAPLAMAANPAAAEDHLKLVIGQINNWENQAPTLGQDVGIFKKHGLVLKAVGTRGAGLQRGGCIVPGRGTTAEHRDAASAQGGKVDRLVGVRGEAGPQGAIDALGGARWSFGRPDRDRTNLGPRRKYRGGSPARHFATALDRDIVSRYAHPGITIDRIVDLVGYEWELFLTPAG